MKYRQDIARYSEILRIFLSLAMAGLFYEMFHSVVNGVPYTDSLSFLMGWKRKGLNAEKGNLSIMLNSQNLHNAACSGRYDFLNFDNGEIFWLGIKREISPNYGL